ncbi:unnamed protein product [Meloidogyne enterolobii]|uniref:Uncharacterized protein n=1 Tax=Meloidogyne enterolobii TaxID=390850 RepID=A0ACB0Z8I7_MELEN
MRSKKLQEHIWQMGKVIEVLDNGNYIVEIASIYKTTQNILNSKNIKKIFQIGEFVSAEKTDRNVAIELAEIIGIKFKDFELTIKRNPKFGKIVYRHRNELSKIEIASFKVGEIVEVWNYKKLWVKGVVRGIVEGNEIIGRETENNYLVEVDGQSKLLKVHPVDIRKFFQVGEVVSVKLDNQKSVQATVENGINKHNMYRMSVKSVDGDYMFIESYPDEIEHIF